MCATVWEVATWQPHLGSWDLHRSCTTTGQFRLCVCQENIILFFKMGNVAIVWFFFSLSSTDFWDLFGSKLSEWHRGCAGKLVSKDFEYTANVLPFKPWLVDKMVWSQICLVHQHLFVYVLAHFLSFPYIFFKF